MLKSGAGGQERSERMSKTGMTGSTGTNTMPFGVGVTTGNVGEKLINTVFPKNETDINVLLKIRLEGIKKQIYEYEKDVFNFSNQADEGLRKLVQNMEHLQKNLNQVNHQTG